MLRTSGISAPGFRYARSFHHSLIASSDRQYGHRLSSSRFHRFINFPPSAANASPPQSGRPTLLSFDFAFRSLRSASFPSASNLFAIHALPPATFNGLPAVAGQFAITICVAHRLHRSTAPLSVRWRSASVRAGSRGAFRQRRAPGRAGRRAGAFARPAARQWRSRFIFAVRSRRHRQAGFRQRTQPFAHYPRFSQVNRYSIFRNRYSLRITTI